MFLTHNDSLIMFRFLSQHLYPTFIVLTNVKIFLIYVDQLRLVNGSSENEGRVEILINKEWGTICGMNIDSARLICRQLGYFG
jgi:hypothetical protein